MQPEWKLADPICTFLFSILVLFTTINILKDTLRVLMEGMTQRSIDFLKYFTMFSFNPRHTEAHRLRGGESRLGGDARG